MFYISFIKYSNSLGSFSCTYIARGGSHDVQNNFYRIPLKITPFKTSHLKFWLRYENPTYYFFPCSILLFLWIVSNVEH